jgi:type IV pilus assembly protein PilV
MTMQNHLSPESGSSLIEVLVALLVFSIGMLGLSALQLNALRGVSDSSQRTQSTWILQDIAERIRANPEAPVANFTAVPDCSALPAKMCADYYQPGGGKVAAGNCSAGEMATFDRWEAECSYAAVAAFNTIDGRFSSRDFVSLPDAGSAISIFQDAADPLVLRIQADWRGQAGQLDASGNARDSQLSIGGENALEVLQ